MIGCCINTHFPAWHTAVPPTGAGQGEQFGAGGAFAPPVDNPKFGFPGLSGAAPSLRLCCSGTTASTGTAWVTGQHPQALR
jgi:hypothetical protein